MTLRISGQNLDIGEALRSHVQARISESLSRYFDHDYTGQVVVKKEGSGFRTDCRIHLPTGLTLQAESIAHDPHVSVDMATERLTKRLRRYKHRLKDYHIGPETVVNGQSTDYVINTLDEEEAVPAEFTPVIVAEKTTGVKQLSVSEAVVELDLTGAAALVFRHSRNDRINVVYRRADGHIGWIDLPQES